MLATTAPDRRPVVSQFEFRLGVVSGHPEAPGEGLRAGLSPTTTQRGKLGQIPLIGVGKAFASPPFEPYVRFSRIRLSSWEFLSSRLSRRQPSRVKGEQPGFREEGLWPALMIGSAHSHARRLLLMSAEKGA